MKETAAHPIIPMRYARHREATEGEAKEERRGRDTHTHTTKPNHKREYFFIPSCKPVDPTDDAVLCHLSEGKGAGAGCEEWECEWEWEGEGREGDCPEIMIS